MFYSSERKSWKHAPNMAGSELGGNIKRRGILLKFLTHSKIKIFKIKSLRLNWKLFRKFLIFMKKCVILAG